MRQCFVLLFTLLFTLAPAVAQKRYRVVASEEILQTLPNAAEAIKQVEELYLPELQQVTVLPPDVETFQVVYSGIAEDRFYTIDYPNKVLVPRYIKDSQYPSLPLNVILHEIAHLGHPPCTPETTIPGGSCLSSNPEVIEEGIAEAAAQLAVQRVMEKYALSERSSKLPGLFFNLTWPLYAAGGGHSFLSNTLSSPGPVYAGVSGVMMLVSRGDLRPFREAIFKAHPQPIVKPDRTLDVFATRELYLRILDQTYPPINGVMPSAFMRLVPETFTEGPDGTFFVIHASDAAADKGRFVPYGGGVPGAIVNPVQMWPYIVERTKGQTLFREDGKVRLTVRKPDGTVVLQGIRAMNDWRLDQSFDPAAGAPSAYTVEACWIPPDKADCTDNPYLRHTQLFLTAPQSAPGWWKEGNLFIFTNGPAYGKLNSTRLTVSGDPRIVATEYPGFLHVRLNSAPYATVTDGQRTVKYEGTHTYITIPWQLQTQPHLYAVVNGASFKQDPVALGQWVSLFHFGAGLMDPHHAEKLPLPPQLGQNRVVITDSRGDTHDCPLNYSSQLQTNCLVPLHMPAGKATFRVVSNGVASNAVEKELAEAAPTAFMATEAQPAVFRHRDGKLVGPDNPVRAGDIVTMYVTGLGPLTADVPDGGAAPLEPLARAALPVTVSVGGKDCGVWYAGLAPFFAGLGQINCQIGPGTPPGTQEVEIRAGQYLSNPKPTLTVQQ